VNRHKPGVVTAADHPNPRLRGWTHSHPYAHIWDAALRLAGSTPRWKVISADSSRGQIVAEATSRLFGFVDDVVIRISLDDRGFTRVDLSSHSRVGRYDFGVNRRRVQRFLRRLNKSLAAR
jgi:uncharacterized protein (DUF1499 family)